MSGESIVINRTHAKPGSWRRELAPVVLMMGLLLTLVAVTSAAIWHAVHQTQAAPPMYCGQVLLKPGEVCASESARLAADAAATAGRIVDSVKGATP